MIESVSGNKGTEAQDKPAMNIVQKVMLKKQKVVLEIQKKKEMVDHHKPLAETSADQELDKLLRPVQLTYDKELKLIRDSMRKADARSKCLLEDHEKNY